MQFAFLENQHEARAFALALGVIVLGVLAITLFVLFGGGAVFYVFAVLAIAVGLYMAYHLSKTPQPAAPAPARARKTARAKARPRKR